MKVHVTKSQTWYLHHPGTFLREVPSIVRQVPQLLRGNRLATANNDGETLQKATRMLGFAQASGDIPNDWRVLRGFLTRSSETVVQVGTSDGIPTAVLKYAAGETSNEHIRAHCATLEQLRLLEGIGDLGRYLPRTLYMGEINNQQFVLEAWIDGIALTDFQSEGLAPAYVQALETLRGLHRAKGRVEVIQMSHLSEWFGETFAALERIWLQRKGTSSEIAKIQEALFASLVGLKVWTGHIHGDFFPGNILVNEHTGALTGIIDWDRSHANRPVFFDATQLALIVHLQETGAPFGYAIRDIIRGKPLTHGAEVLLEISERGMPDLSIPVRLKCIMLWLNHVGENLRDNDRYANHHVWVQSNLQSVVTALRQTSFTTWA